MATTENGGTVSYHIESVGMTNMEEAIARLGRAPDFVTIGALEGVFAAQYADTQARVHVITGSLKLSGKPTSDYDGRVWEGTITYGGESGGVHNPVTYAIYELARHGTHDFFAGVYGQDFNDAYMRALETHFEESSGQ